MSVEEKQITIAQNVPKVFNAGYEKGKAENGTAKEEQEKTVTITENGTTEVLPDEGKTLSKVTVDVDVADSYWNAFWDEFQKNGTRTNYKNAFYWRDNFVTDTFFKPKYDFRLTGNNSGMFKGSRITNLAQILKDCNVVLDTSKVTDANELFAYANYLTHMPCISFESCVSINSFALGCLKLHHIEKIIVVKELILSSNCFQDCGELTTIAEIEGEFGTSLNMASCSKLDDLTIDNIVNAYADMTGQTAPILTVHPDVKAKIEANETWLNTLINKNVTLA